MPAAYTRLAAFLAALTVTLPVSQTALPEAAQAPALAPAAAPVPLGSALPVRADSVKFAVIGDSGTGGSAQYQIGERLVAARSRFPFDFVIMLGDNMYGSERPQDFEKKFTRPYKPLIDAKVEFYAALGNHDDPNQRYFKPFNMNGERHYTYKKGPVRFFVLDSNYLDKPQLAWFERELAASNEKWKIAYFHHPLYSSGARHGSEVDLRILLEPLFLKYGVNIVFAGHEHFYERIRPQKGVQYFTSGAAGKLRRGNIRTGELTAAGFDTDYSFMLVEIADEECFFETISRPGRIVDSGSFKRPEQKRDSTASGVSRSQAFPNVAFRVAGEASSARAASSS
jgi:predicted phosphodiesterase